MDMGFESFPTPESNSSMPEEMEVKKEEILPEAEKMPEGTRLEDSAEKISSEVQEKAARFDAELHETIKTRIDAGTLSAEQAKTISDQAERLKTEDKAALAEKLEKGQLLPRTEEQEQAARELQEQVTQYETAVDHLVGRAKALGIDVSPEGLKSYLENLKNAEPDAEGNGEETWNQSFEQRLKELETQVEQMERMKQDGSLASGKGAEAQREFQMNFNQLVEKLAEYAVKFAVAIFKGLYKGIRGILERKG